MVQIATLLSLLWGEYRLVACIARKARCKNEISTWRGNLDKDTLFARGAICNSSVIAKDLECLFAFKSPHLV